MNLCIHLGADTGKTVACGSCSGRVRIKLRACAIHEECTLGKKVVGVACCAECRDRQQENDTPCLPSRSGQRG